MSRLRGVFVCMLSAGLAIGGAFYGGLAEAQQAVPPTAATQVPAANDQAASPAKKNHPIAVDLYGDPLPEGALARIGTLRYRHPSHISFLALAPKGEFIVSQASDGVRVWETRTGKELKYYPELVGYSNTECDLSPDGKTLATPDRKSNTLVLWDIATGRRERSLGQAGNLARFSPDGRLLISNGGDTAKLWNTVTGETLRSWQPHGRYVFMAAFSRDGKTLITHAGQIIRFWDIATGKQTREISTDSKSINQIALSPDGKLLASLGTKVTSSGNNASLVPEDFIRIWDVVTGKEVRQLGNDKNDPVFGGLTDFLFAPDGKSIVTSGLDPLQVWDPATGKELRRIPLDSYASWHLAFSRDGKTLATATGMLTIRVFDPLSGKDLAPPGELQLGVQAALSASGRTLATYSDRKIQVWDPITGWLRFRLDGHKKWVTDICIAGDGRTLFSASQDKRISAWDLETRTKLREFRTNALSGWPRLAAAPDGKTLAVTNGKLVEVLDTATGKQLKELSGHEPSVSHVAFIDGGKKLAVCSADNKVHLWDLVGGRKILQFPFPKDRRPPRPETEAAAGGFPSYHVAISPDGRLIAYGNQYKTLALMELATGREIACFTNLPDFPITMALSPDGRTLAWGGWTGAPVRLLETASGKERRRLLGHKGQVFSLAYSADGKMLVSGSLDTTALVWDLAGRHETRKTPLSAKELSVCWEDLASEDAARAFQAIRKMVADPGQVIPFLGEKLQPVHPVDKRDLDQLITNLGSDVFAVRDNARRELEKLGEIAAYAAHVALKEPATLEVRRRLEGLVEKQKQYSNNPSPDFLRSLRALETLETAGTPEARKILARMSEGASEARLTGDANAALERLSRLPSSYRDTRPR